MKTPRDLSGAALAERLCQRWGYRKIHQEGSHIILETADPSHQRIAVPAHKALRIGTLNSVLRSISRHRGVTRQDIIDSL